MREWFHNNTRVLCGPAILKIKPKPKMLQSWQAYHALTYEKQWKPYVDKKWEMYKEEWEAGNPTEKKPPKSRFQLMVEFMKEKYENESVEMKLRCEEYRRARKESPAPTDSDAARNLRFQK